MDRYDDDTALPLVGEIFYLFVNSPHNFKTLRTIDRVNQNVPSDKQD